MLFATKTIPELKNEDFILEKITVHQIINFLSKLLEYDSIVELNDKKIKFLESTFKLTNSKNSEIRFVMMRLCIRAKLMDRLHEIIAFVNSNFRMKFCRPIYRDLAKWDEARPIAIANFKNIKDQMMEVCVHTIEKDLGLR